jgi:hypothetical protein
VKTAPRSAAALLALLAALAGGLTDGMAARRPLPPSVQALVEGRWPAGTFFWEVKVVGHYAYSVHGSPVLAVIDVSNPTNARPVGGFDFGYGYPKVTRYASPRAVAVAGSYAYVADSEYGLHVIDVSIPDDCVRVGSLAISGGAWDVAVTNDYAYVATSSNGLQVIDLLDPVDGVRVGGCDTSVLANRVVVVGHHAYVATHFHSGFQVIDVSDPRKCVPVGGYVTRDDAKLMAVSGQYAYLAVWDNDPFVEGFTYRGLDVIDVRNPTNCVRVGGWTNVISKYPQVNVAVAGHYAYEAVSHPGTQSFQVIDVRNPANCVRVGGMPGYKSMDGWRVTVSGKYAYLTGPGFHVIDVSNPTNCVRIGGSPLSEQFR